PVTSAYAKTYFEKAQELIESGRETEARRALRQELSQRPNHLEARYNLAILLERIEHTDEAEKVYQQNMRHGLHLPTMINLSAIYTRQGKRKESVELLKMAAKRFRSEAPPYYLLAQRAEDDNNLRLARTYFQKAIRADPLNGFAHIRFGRFLSAHGQVSQALIHARRAIKLVPDCAPCWQIQGDILWKAGNLKRSYAAYQKSSALSPNVKLRTTMAKLLHSMGETERAEAIERSLKLTP
ncbi:MAG: tetratricopeptide repeat protein, partial [Mariprofundus sp.]